MRIERTPYLCDACASVEPVTRYDVPPGTPLTCLADTSTGEATLLKSAGAIGLCAGCRELIEREGTGDRAARKLAQRIAWENLTLRPIVGGRRRLILEALEKLWTRLLPLLKNPRPCVRGEDPSDELVVWDDAPGEAPSVDQGSN